MIKSINELTPPNLDNMALLADVQAYEPYGSAALNRQLRGVLSKGVYSGFNVAPSAGLKVNVTSAGVYSAAAVEVSDKWLITVRQQSDVVLTVPAGRLSSVVLKAFYDGKTITNQVDADSAVKASELLVVNAGSEPADSLILCQINVPSNASSITSEMISYDKRDRVSLEGFWNKLDSEHIAPKGQWFRTILNKGIKPSLDNVRSAAVDTIGTPTSWFQEIWANKYRGGSIDIEGTIRAGGKLAMLQGDFGIGNTSKLMAANTDLNSLPLENAKYRGTGLLNTPEGAAGSSGWWFVDHECHSLEHQVQRAIKYAATGHYGVWYRVKLNNVWAAWDCLYSVNNKPTKTDVGLSNVANERQYSAQNNNIGTGATNYAAGNHNHDDAYSKLGHKHVWSDITDPPVHATRWPTLAEIGAQPAGSYAAASHTHPWSQITGAPVYTTRWPTWDELSGKPPTMPPSSHTHPWSQITGAPVYTTRWPTLAEIGAQPAGSYAAASHAHPWSQITGAPVYATRWPTLAEIGAADLSGWRNQTISFVVGGDANTYYPVLIYKGNGSEIFGMDEIHISRHYAATAPSSWNTATHRGGLTLSVAYSGDSSWGGNDHFVKVSHFSEQYTTLVAGLELTTSGLIVWLRGGGAEYKLNTQNGQTAGATVHIGNFTAGDGKVYSPQARNADTVAAQIYARMPLRGLDVYDNNVRVYSYHNRPSPAEIGAAPTSHAHASISTNYTNWVGNSEAAIVGGLAWRHYGNSHVIFDASSSKTPAGTACDNSNPQSAWAGTHPTLMGFNGSTTYGVRVDRARVAETLNGLDMHYDRNNEANKVVRTDASGYLQIGWLNTISGATASGTLFACFNGTNDMYLRYMSAEQTRNAIGAQPAGSYAAASHTHPWSQITGIPAEATRWPTAAEVGLGNVPNIAHSYEGYAWHVPIRDSAGDITSRLFRSEFGNDTFINGGIAFRTASSGDNYIRFCSNPDAVRNWIGAAPASHSHSWGQIAGIPVFATRWPTWAEIGGKPPSVGSDTGWITVPQTAKTGTNLTLQSRKVMRYRVLNGVIYFDFQIVFLDAGTTVAYTRLPNWSYGEKFVAGTGFGDRGGGSESKLFKITAAGDIYNAIVGMSQFHVVTGLHPTPVD